MVWGFGRKYAFSAPGNTKKSAFFEFFQSFRATAPPDAQQNCRKHAKYVSLKSPFNCSSNYAVPQLNPYRPVKIRVWNFQNMQRKSVTKCKVRAWATPKVIINLFLNAFQTFVATSPPHLTYVLINFKGSNFQILDKIDPENPRSCVNNWTDFSGELFEISEHHKVTLTTANCISIHFESGARGRPQFTYVNLYILRICTFQTSRPAQYEQIAPKIAACDPRGSIC